MCLPRAIHFLPTIAAPHLRHLGLAFTWFADLNIGANPVIFVVHSMGGLVVKKAYLLAASFQSTKYFTSDLTKASPAIEELNEQFWHVAPKLSIWSFYKTPATSTGPLKVIVLEKDSSVLGYPAEISRPLQANHHNICKFSSPADPNYISVRDAITSLITQHQGKNSENRRSRSQSATPAGESPSTQDLFRDAPSTEADYDASRRSWIPDTCEWILEEKAFVSWLDTLTLDPAVLWYTAPPATGKTVLSAFIINHLRRKHMSCQFFIFKFSDTAKSTVANCIKALTYQLSKSRPEFGKALAGSSREALCLDSSDPFLIWKRVVEGVLMQLSLDKPIYWVIDALDECDSPKILLACLQSFAHRLPVKVMFLSRGTPNLSLHVLADFLAVYLPLGYKNCQATIIETSKCWRRRSSRACAGVRSFK
ncbi:hypothetical protein F4808DRAFT_475592 [Astrocystis sublimbata]|nr:hypothetical protein F4808DRAFT_475592 [Astrocystis sublimbata]